MPTRYDVIVVGAGLSGVLVAEHLAAQGHRCLIVEAGPALARPFPLYVVVLTALVGISTLSLANTLWQTTLQAHIPPARLSRVSAYDWLGSLIFSPVGYAVAGPLAAAIGTRATLLVSAGILGSSGLVVGLLPDVRAVRRG